MRARDCAGASSAPASSPRSSPRTSARRFVPVRNATPSRAHPARLAAPSRPRTPRVGATRWAALARRGCAIDGLPFVLVSGSMAPRPSRCSRATPRAREPSAPRSASRPMRCAPKTLLRSRPPSMWPTSRRRTPTTARMPCGACALACMCLWRSRWLSLPPMVRVCTSEVVDARRGALFCPAKCRCSSHIWVSAGCHGSVI